MKLLSQEKIDSLVWWLERYPWWPQVFATIKERKMKLWILTRPQSDWFADEAQGFVIRAADKTQARLLAAGAHLSEGGKTWFLENETLCEELIDDGKAEIIMRT